jgi:hypothetical protein
MVKYVERFVFHVISVFILEDFCIIESERKKHIMYLILTLTAFSGHWDRETIKIKDFYDFCMREIKYALCGDHVLHALCGDHVLHLFICNLVSMTEAFVGVLQGGEQA